MMSNIEEMVSFKFCNGQTFLVFKKDTNLLTVLDKEVKDVVNEINELQRKERDAQQRLSSLKNSISEVHMVSMKRYLDSICLDGFVNPSNTSSRALMFKIEGESDVPSV